MSKAKNYSNITVDLTARADDTFDGWYGSLEGIDTQASHAKLQQLITESLKKHFPGVNVEQSGRGSVRGECIYGENSLDEEQDIRSFLALVTADHFEDYEEWIVNE